MICCCHLAQAQEAAARAEVARAEAAAAKKVRAAAEAKARAAAEAKARAAAETEARAAAEAEAAAGVVARLTDYTHISTMLSPMSGIFREDNPELSVSDALAPLIVPLQLDALLWTAQQAMRKKATKALIAAVPGFTADCGAAVYMYTAESPLYRRLNAALRSADRQQAKPFFPYLRLLLTAMNKLWAHQAAGPRLLNRGVKLDLVGAHPDEYEEGESLVWWPLSSCTRKIAVLNNPMFLGISGDRTIFQVKSCCFTDASLSRSQCSCLVLGVRVVYVIWNWSLPPIFLPHFLVSLLCCQLHTSKGVDVTAFSAVQSEAEVLLPPVSCPLSTPAMIRLLTSILHAHPGLCLHHHERAGQGRKRPYHCAA